MPSFISRAPITSGAVQAVVQAVKSELRTSDSMQRWASLVGRIPAIGAQAFAKHPEVPVQPATRAVFAAQVSVASPTAAPAAPSVSPQPKLSF